MSRDASVLLVDDDEDFIRIARRAIDRAGIRARVAVAHDGDEALRALGLEGAYDVPRRPPVVVLLDLNMPARNGWDVLKRIREHAVTHELPVVVVSSSDRPRDVRQSYALGANSFVVKRFDPGKPGEYVADAIRYWVELNEPPPAGPSGTAP
jgi:CheY-like chemotaxis protein